MPTLTYVKGLPTPASELNVLGFTDLEMFLGSFAPIFRDAAIETVNHLLSGAQFNKSTLNAHLNAHLQKTYKINKRHANGVIVYAKGKVDGAKEHRALHIKTLKGKAKSIEAWIKKAEGRLKLARKFYGKKNWQNSKTGCNFPLSCSLNHKNTNWQNLKFQLHGKKRKLHLIQSKLEFLKHKPIRVSVPRGQVFLVGSKDESFGNQVAQWDGKTIKLRVPACLESRFGKYVLSEVGNFERNINRLTESGSKTWHLFKKNGKWNIAVQFTPTDVKRQSKERAYGCIGIDINPGSIGWSYVDTEGNMKAHGQIQLEIGLPSGKQQAQFVDACLSLANLAVCFACPVVCEELDFSDKKERLGEQGKKYARMLSSWGKDKIRAKVIINAICRTNLP